MQFLVDERILGADGSEHFLLHFRPHAILLLLRGVCHPSLRAVEQWEDVVFRLYAFLVIKLENLQRLWHQLQVAVLMVLAHLVVQPSVGGHIHPSQLYKVPGSDAGTVEREEKVVAAVPYQTAFGQVKCLNCLQFLIVQLLLYRLHSRVFELQERIVSWLHHVVDIDGMVQNGFENVEHHLNCVRVKQLLRIALIRQLMQVGVEL